MTIMINKTKLNMIGNIRSNPVVVEITNLIRT
jgi:hypothetical protein